MVFVISRCSGASCASCHTRYAEIRNDTTITSDASPPEIDLGSRLPIVELTTKPANGSSGMSGINAVIGSPLQRGEGIGVERFPAAEERDDERQPHGGLGGGDGHDEEGDDLPVDGAVESPE